MWNLIRDLGDGEKLVRCSECGYQMATQELLNECPNCGEMMGGVAQKIIDLKKSSLEVRDTEPAVYEYERDTPVYKLWYFWVVAVIVVLGLLIGARYALSHISLEQSTGSESSGSITFTVPTGWSKINDATYTGPGEGSNITIITCDVSRLDKVDNFGKLVGDLTEIDEIESKEVNGIDGRYINWKTRKVINGEEVFTDYARYVFIYKSKLYVLTFKTSEGTVEAFDSFLLSIQKQ